MKKPDALPICNRKSLQLAGKPFITEVWTFRNKSSGTDENSNITNNLLPQRHLERWFQRWVPEGPEVVARGIHSVTLSWQQTEEALPFLVGESAFVYRVQRREKIPPWVTVYSGGHTTKVIDNLAPCSPHKFRLQVVLKASALEGLAEKALQYYGNEEAVYEKYNSEQLKETDKCEDGMPSDKDGDKLEYTEKRLTNNASEHGNDDTENNSNVVELKSQVTKRMTKNKWLESQWSEPTWTSTHSDGTSASCFCMAVRGGYLKQMQMMLEERPALIGMINSTNGFTPLATAVRKGDINTVRFLVASGAELDQPSGTGQTPLHLAVLAGRAALVDLLLDKGADFNACDVNELRVEHYAVDSGLVEMVQLVLDRGGDLTVRDNNGWTPLFRAVIQGSSTALVEELVTRGSDLEVRDAAGLPLVSAARLLTDTHGRSRDSILRLVDSQYPHEKAVANFTRLTKKISRVHTVFKC